MKNSIVAILLLFTLALNAQELPPVNLAYMAQCDTCAKTNLTPPSFKDYRGWVLTGGVMMVTGAALLAYSIAGNPKGPSSFYIGLPALGWGTVILGISGGSYLGKRANYRHDLRMSDTAKYQSGKEYMREQRRILTPGQQKMRNDLYMTLPGIFVAVSCTNNALSSRKHKIYWVPAAIGVADVVYFGAKYFKDRRLSKATKSNVFIYGGYNMVGLVYNF